ncbi:MAG: SDR family oxidoreductase [Planctomycetota bacterium]|nr:SDR family oxidoreductase [Planctomycetota bacterium]
MTVSTTRESLDRMIVGCGYLGLRVARRWLDQGLTVAATTRTAERADSFRQLGITPILADVTDAESLRNLPRADVVLYAVGFDRNAGRSKRDVYVNGLRNVLDALQPNAGRFIYISSTSVYGQVHGECVDESSTCEPTSEGGRICLEAENLVRSRCNDVTGTLEFNVLRLAGIYGPDRLLRRIEQLRSAESIAGSADAYLNLIHVDDAVSVVLACAEQWAAGRTFLVADGNEGTRGDYFRALAETLDVPPPTFDDASTARHGTGQNKLCINRQMLEQLRVRLQYGDLRIGIQHAVSQSTRRDSQ